MRRDKAQLQDKIRQLRAEGKTLQAIAASLQLPFGYVRWFAWYYGIPRFLKLSAKDIAGEQESS